MRFSSNCGVCGELIYYEIDEVTNPSDLVPASEIIKQKFGDVDMDQLAGSFEEWFEGKKYKQIRIYKNCPKCGTPHRIINWIPLN